MRASVGARVRKRSEGDLNLLCLVSINFIHNGSVNRRKGGRKCGLCLFGCVRGGVCIFAPLTHMPKVDERVGVGEEEEGGGKERASRGAQS